MRSVYSVVHSDTMAEVAFSISQKPYFIRMNLECDDVNQTEVRDTIQREELVECLRCF